jgi:hypothetical protein
MWLLIEVDHSTDVGKNEKNRYLLSDNLIIVNTILSAAIIALGERVHPATP